MATTAPRAPGSSPSARCRSTGRPAGSSTCPSHVITQLRDGDGLGHERARAAGAGARRSAAAPAPAQDTQSLRSLTMPADARRVRAQRGPGRRDTSHRKEIDKVVLARVGARAPCPSPSTPPRSPSGCTHREPLCTVYSMPTPDGRRFVGASPSSSRARGATLVRCHPLAGHDRAPAATSRPTTTRTGCSARPRTCTSTRAVDEIVTAPREPCTTTSTPTRRPRSSRCERWRTSARGSTRRAATPRAHPTRLAVLRLLHPTAAVGGDAAPEPRPRCIARLEQHDRGYYAGPRRAGWTRTATASGGSAFAASSVDGNALRSVGRRGHRERVRPHRRARGDQGELASFASVARPRCWWTWVLAGRRRRRGARAPTSSPATAPRRRSRWTSWTRPCSRSVKEIGTSTIEAPRAARAVGHLDLEAVAVGVDGVVSRSCRARRANRRDSRRSSPPRAGRASSTRTGCRRAISTQARYRPLRDRARRGRSATRSRRRGSPRR